MCTSCTISHPTQRLRSSWDQCVSTCESRNCRNQKLKIFFFWETVNYETVNLWPRWEPRTSTVLHVQDLDDPNQYNKMKVTVFIQTSLCVICLSEIHRWQRSSRVGSLQNKTRRWDTPRISKSLSLDNFESSMSWRWTPTSLIPTRSQSLSRSLSRTPVSRGSYKKIKRRKSWYNLSEVFSVRDMNDEYNITMGYVQSTYNLV